MSPSRMLPPKVAQACDECAKAYASLSGVARDGVMIAAPNKRALLQRIAELLDLLERTPTKKGPQ